MAHARNARWRIPTREPENVSLQTMKRKSSMSCSNFDPARPRSRRRKRQGTLWCVCFGVLTPKLFRHQDMTSACTCEHLLLSFSPPLLPRRVHPITTYPSPDPLSPPGNARLVRISCVQVLVRAQLHHVLRALEVWIPVVKLLDCQHLPGVEGNGQAFGDRPRAAAGDEEDTCHQRDLLCIYRSSSVPQHMQTHHSSREHAGETETTTIRFGDIRGLCQEHQTTEGR